VAFDRNQPEIVALFNVHTDTGDHLSTYIIPGNHWHMTSNANSSE
jgi:hypothetical protein